MNVVFSRTRKLAALATSALLAAGLLTAGGLGAAAAQADDSGTGSADITVHAPNWGSAERADVTAYLVTGSGSSAQYSEADDETTAGDSDGDDVPGMAVFDGSLVLGAHYVFEVSFTSDTFYSDPQVDGDGNPLTPPFGSTFFGTTSANSPAAAGVYTATTSESFVITLNPGYSISGTVHGDADYQFAAAYRESDTDPGTWVQENYSGIDADQSGDTTDGTYSIPELRPGNYKLQFSATGTDATTYSGGGGSLAGASIVTLGSADVTAPDVTMISDSYTISGTLEDPNGNALGADSGAFATLYEADGTTQVEDNGGVPADDSGAISFPNLAAGNYILQTNGADQQTAPYGDYYNDQPDLASATPITVGPSASASGLDFKLSNGFSLSGKVTTSVGAPVDQADVSIFPADGDFTNEVNYDFTPFDTETDSSGNYSFSSLPPGDYYVQVDSGDSTQFVSSTGTTSDRSAATKLVYEDGARNLNISLIPVTSVDIHLTTPAGVTDSSASVTLYTVVGGKVDDSNPIYATPVSGKPGVYSADELDSNATYTADIDPGLAGYDDQYLGGSATADSAKTFTLKPGPNSINAVIAAPTSLSGTVTDKATGKALANVLVSLYGFDGKNWVLYNSDYNPFTVNGAIDFGTTTTSKGKYSFPDVEPGSYKVEFGSLPGDPKPSSFFPTQTVVAQFSGGASTLASATPVYVSAKTPGVQNAAMVDGGALSGVLTSAGKALAGAEVIPYYVGTDGSADPVADYEHSAVTSKTGAYKITGLNAGVWKLAYVVNPLKVSAYSGYVGGSSLATATPFTVVAAKTTAVASTVVASPTSTTSTVNLTFQDSSGNPVDSELLEAELVPTSGPAYEKCYSNDYFIVLCGDTTGDGSSTGNAATIPGVPAGTYDLLVRSYFDDGKYLPSVTSLTVTAGGAPVNQTIALQDAHALKYTANPTVDSSGGLAVGDTVSATDGTVDQDDTTTTYQWYRSADTGSAPGIGDLTLIRGAQDPTYTLRSGDFGDDVTVRVTHTTSVVADGETLYTDDVSALASSGPVVTATQGLDAEVYIYGSPEVGGTLTANVTTAGGPANSYTYQWIRTSDAGSVDIPGATKSSYVVQPLDYNSADSDDNGLLSVRVTAVRTGSPDSEPVTSELIDVEAADAVVVAKAPTVSSKTSGGVTTYTVKPGTYATAGATEQYDWLVDGTEVDSSQNGHASFGPTSGQASGSIVVRVSATLVGHLSRVTTLVAHKGTQAPTVTNAAIDNTTSESGTHVGDVLQAVQGQWNYPDGSQPSGYRYQWYDLVGTKATAIKKATSPTYTVTTADLGKSIELFEIADSAKYVSGFITPTTGAVTANETLVDSATVTVPMAVAIGGTVTATVSGLPSAAKYTYQWEYEPSGSSNAWVNIAKATKSSYAVPTTDADGDHVRVIATPSITGYDLHPAISSAVLVDTTIHPLTLPAISPSGSATVGEKLTAISGTTDISGTTATYHWFDADADPSAPDLQTGGSTYIVTAATVGDHIALSEGWTKGSLTGGALATGNVLVIAAATSPLAPSTDVSLGTVNVGTPVQAPSASQLWSGIPDGFTNYKVTYQWNLAGKAISKATASSYTPLSTQVGKALTVTAKISSPSYTAPAATTLPSTVALAAAPTFTVISTQNSTQTAPGVMLTSTVTNPSTTGLKYTYQWTSNPGNGTWSPIAGATKATYVVPASLLGDYVEVVVTATKAGYTTGVVEGNSAFYVGGIAAITATGAATLTATPTVGTPVGVNATFDTTKGVTLGYQWMLDGVDIPGATTATFVPTADELTQDLSAQVTATEPGYYEATTASNELAVVRGAAPTMSTTASKKAVITGTAAKCAPLTVSTGLWSIPGLAVTYQWYRGSTAIDGAVDASYQPQVADNGSALHVVLTATSTGYADGTYPTAATPVVATCS